MFWINIRLAMIAVLLRTSATGEQHSSASGDDETHQDHSAWHRVRLVRSDPSACDHMRRVTSNFCSYPVVRDFCPRTCPIRTSPDALDCGTKSPIPVSPDIVSRSRKDRHKSTEHHRARRIVGGKLSAPGNWPWHVSLRCNGTQFCGASILTPYFVVSAAHCFRMNESCSRKAEDWSISAGDFHMLKNETFEQFIDVKHYFVHELFSIEDTSRNDIAIIQLKEPINFDADRSIAPVCLPARVVEDDTECDIFGWGHTQYEGNQSVRLREAKVRVVSHAQCNSKEAYNGNASDTVICAGYRQGGTDACQFDSGGSLSCKKGERWYIDGIVSSGDKCAAPNKYGLYTKVFVLARWLLEKVLVYGVEPGERRY